MTVMVQTTTNYNTADEIVSVIVFRVPVEDKLTPTDAQIMRKALEEIAEDPTGVSIYQAEIAKAALTAAAEVGVRRVLKEVDAFCPSCGHNRDKSAVSSIDHGNFKSCQKCGAEWTEIAAAEVGPDEKLIERCKRLTKDRSEIEARTIERCAQYHDNAARECEAIAAVNMDNNLGPSCQTRAIDHRLDAAAIRALMDKP